MSNVVSDAELKLLVNKERKLRVGGTATPIPREDIAIPNISPNYTTEMSQYAGREHRVTEIDADSYSYTRVKLDNGYVYRAEWLIPV